MWLSAAPAVTKRPDFTIMLRFVEQHVGVPLPEQRRQPPRGGDALMVEQPRLRQHEGADAGRATSSRRGAPTAAAPSPASRTSARVSAVSRGPGILNPMAGTTTQSGAALRRAAPEHRRPCEVLTARRTPTILTSNRGDREPGHLAQLVRRLEGVEDRGEPEVEDTVERENVHPHGKDDIKGGVLAYGNSSRLGLRFDRAPLRLKGERGC